MSAVQRARVFHMNNASESLGVLKYFDVKKIVKQKSLQQLQQITNTCQRMKINSFWYQKETLDNKLKFLQSYQYSINYSKNLKKIYDQKQKQLFDQNMHLKKEIASKKNQIKDHKKKVQSMKDEFRTLKIQKAKNIYHQFEQKLQKIKNQQYELTEIKQKMENQLQQRKKQLNSVHQPQIVYYYPYQGEYNGQIPNQNQNLNNAAINPRGAHLVPYSPKIEANSHVSINPNYQQPHQKQQNQVNPVIHGIQGMFSQQPNIPQLQRQLSSNSQNSYQSQNLMNLTKKQKQPILNPLFAISSQHLLAKIQETDAKTRQTGKTGKGLQILKQDSQKIIDEYKQQKDDEGFDYMDDFQNSRTNSPTAQMSKDKIQQGFKNAQRNQQYLNNSKKQQQTNKSSNEYLNNSYKAQDKMRQTDKSIDDQELDLVNGLNESLKGKSGINYQSKINNSKKSRIYKSSIPKQPESSILQMDDSFLNVKLKNQSKAELIKSKKGVDSQNTLQNYNNETKNKLFNPNNLQRKQNNLDGTQFLGQSKKSSLQIPRQEIRYSQIQQFDNRDLLQSTKGQYDISSKKINAFNNRPQRRAQVRQSSLGLTEINQSKAYSQFKSSQLDDKNDIDQMLQLKQLSKVSNPSKNNLPPKVVIGTSISQIKQEQQSDITESGNNKNPQKIDTPPKYQKQIHNQADQYDQDFQIEDVIKNKSIIKIVVDQQKHPELEKNFQKSRVDISISPNNSFNQVGIQQSPYLQLSSEKFEKKSQFRKELNLLAVQRNNETYQKGIFVNCQPDSRKIKNLIQSSINIQILKTEQNDFLDDDIPLNSIIGKKPKGLKKTAFLSSDQAITSKYNIRVINDQNNIISSENILRKSQKNPLKQQENQLLVINNPLLVSRNGLNQSQKNPNPSTLELIESRTFDMTKNKGIQKDQEIEEQINRQNPKRKQYEKQQIQKYIIKIIRNKNKEVSTIKPNKLQAINKNIQFQIATEINSLTNLKMDKIKDWGKIQKIFNQKVIQFNKNKINQEQEKQKSKAQQNTSIGILKNTEKTQTFKKQSGDKQFQQNFQLNYSASIIKDSNPNLKKQKMKIQLPQEEEDELTLSLRQKSMVGLKAPPKYQHLVQSDQFSELIQKSSIPKYERKNNFNDTTQRQKVAQVSKSKYAIKNTKQTPKSLPKQTIVSKIQQNKYGSIEDPLANDLNKGKSKIMSFKSVKPTQDDDDF